VPIAPNIELARCLICGRILVKNEKILIPHQEFAFGIHPSEARQWPAEKLPFAKWDCRVCAKHQALQKLIFHLGQILPFRTCGLDMPDYLEWLGHWITVTRRLPEFYLLFNIQIAQRQFCDIISALSEQFPEPALLLKNY